MRSFYIACIILTVIVTAIIVNSFYVINKIDELLVLCDRIESGDEDSIPADIILLTSKWEECRDKISLSINHNEIDQAEISLQQLAAYYESDSLPDFHANIESLRIALDHISKAQEFSFDNIF